MEASSIERPEQDGKEPDEPLRSSEQQLLLFLTMSSLSSGAARLACRGWQQHERAHLQQRQRGAAVAERRCCCRVFALPGCLSSEAHVAGALRVRASSLVDGRSVTFVLTSAWASPPLI